MRLQEFSSKQNTDRGTSGVVSDTRSLLMGTLSPHFLSTTTHQSIRSFFRLNCSVTWLQQTFSEADKNGDGTLSIGEVHQLLHKLNVNLPKQKVRQMFQVRLEATGYHRLNTVCTTHFCGQPSHNQGLRSGKCRLSTVWLIVPRGLNLPMVMFDGQCHVLSVIKACGVNPGHS